MKQFLIVGNIGAVKYKEVFPYIKTGEVKYRPQRIHKFLNGAAAATWYTTFTVSELPFLELTRTYNLVDYPKYDNYDAIEVSRTKDIPCDYPGVMGVPTTFLDKHNPQQFEIIGLLCDNRCGYPFINGVPTYTDEKHKNSVCGVLGGKRIFDRILIRHRK